MNKLLKYFLIFILLVGSAFGIWYFSNRKSESSVTISIPKDYLPNVDYEASLNARDLSFASKATAYENTGGALLFNLTGDVPTGSTKVKSLYPSTKLNNYKSDAPNWTAENREANKARIKELWAEYGKYITEASEIHRIPNHIILTIIAIEHNNTVSVVKAASENKGLYKGLAQIALKTAKDTLVRYSGNGWITKAQLKPFQDRKLVDKNGDIVIGVSDLLKPDVNIHACAATLSGLAFKYGFINTFRWIFSYNRGEGRLTTDGTQDLSMDALISHYIKNPTHYIGAEYLLKALGKNGAADIIFNDLAIQN